MSATLTASRPLVASPAVRWSGRIATAVTVLFMLLDCSMKIMRSKAAIDGSVQLGYQPNDVPIIGVIAAVLLVLYLVPRTAVLGAILWTGYLGGAVASNLRIENPLFSHTLFPVYFAALLWAALYARDPRVRMLIGAAMRPRDT